MARTAALILGLVPGAAAWALFARLGFEWLVALGAVGVGGALWTLALPLSREVRAAVAGFACVALLGTTGLRMAGLAGSFRPFSTWMGLEQKDLVELSLPVASEGVYFWDKPDIDEPRTILNLDRYSRIMWKQNPLCLDELDRVLRPPGGELLLRADMEAPSLHLGWIASLAAAKGYGEVRVAVRKFGRFPDEERLLGAELSGQYWPELDLGFPIVPAEGLRVRIVASGWRDAPWPPNGPWGGPPPVPQESARIATRVSYELGDRKTGDLRELALWMRRTPPRSIDADPQVPLKHVVAVQNEIRKAGHPAASIVLPGLAPKSLWQAKYLPYPLER